MSDIRPFYGRGEAVQIREKSEVEQLRDEVARLRAFIQRVGHPQWCSGFMTRNIDACTCGYYVIIPPVQAALTPQAGKGGGA